MTYASKISDQGYDLAPAYPDEQPTNAFSKEAAQILSTAPKDAISELRSNFKLMDVDKSGGLSLNELDLGNLSAETNNWAREKFQQLSDVAREDHKPSDYTTFSDIFAERESGPVHLSNSLMKDDVPTAYGISIKDLDSAAQILDRDVMPEALSRAAETERDHAAPTAVLTGLTFMGMLATRLLSAKAPILANALMIGASPLFAQSLYGTGVNYFGTETGDLEKSIEQTRQILGQNEHEEQVRNQVKSLLS